VVGGPSGPGLDDDSSIHTYSGSDEGVVNGSNRGERRDVGGGLEVTGGPRLVGEDDDLSAGHDGSDSLVAKVVDGIIEVVGSLGNVVTGGDDLILETAILRLCVGLDLVEVLGGKDWRVEADETGSLLLDLVDGALLSKHHVKGHDDTLTEGVNGGVGDLSEPLLEVVVKRVGPLAEYGDRRVVAHTVGSLLAGGGHVVDLHGDVLKTPTEGFLKAGRPDVVVHPVGVVGGSSNVLGLLLEPFAVGVSRGNLRLNLEVVLPLASVKVNVDHLSGSEASLLNDGTLVQARDDSSLTHHVNSTVFSPTEPRGAESVTVQTSTDGLAVAEDEEGGAVPCLEDASVEIVEVDDLGVVSEGGLR